MNRLITECLNSLTHCFASSLVPSLVDGLLDGSVDRSIASLNNRWSGGWSIRVLIERFCAWLVVAAAVAAAAAAVVTLKAPHWS